MHEREDAHRTGGEYATLLQRKARYMGEQGRAVKTFHMIREPATYLQSPDSKSIDAERR